jgi:ABC-type dipeptide/oligopeptide/nickel transport system permease component
MAGFVAKRLGWMVVVLLGVATLTFLVAYAIPGNPARMIAGPGATAATIASIDHQLGLDRPLWVQYGQYLWRLVHGNLGISFLRKEPVLPAILARAPVTAMVAVGGVFFELLIGIPVGVLAALKPGSLWDRVATVFALLGLSAPPFWLGLFLLYYLAFVHPWFPLGGIGHPLVYYLFLPCLTVGLNGAAWYSRMLRSTMLDILRAPFIQMARAKGVPRGLLLRRHVLPNVIIPIITMVGMDFGYFLGGVLIIEVVFGIPGLGQQAWQAIQVLDIPMIMGTVLFAAFCIVFLNILVDLSYALIDPRVRLK